MKKIVSLPIKIKNTSLKNKVYNVDIPITVSEQDLAKINIDAGFLTGGSILALMTTLATAGGAGGAAVATIGAVTITAGIIGSAVGLIGAVVALGIFIPALVNIIRDANTTSLILLNTVPNSTMRIIDVVLDKKKGGTWIDTDEAAIKRDVADVAENEAGALIFRTQPKRSMGWVKGHFVVELIFTKTGRKEKFNVYWDNPLGPDRKNSKAVYSTSLPTGVQSTRFIYAPKPDLQHPNVTRAGGRKVDQERHDIVTYVIAPSRRGLEQIV